MTIENFSGEKPTPANPKAEAFALALLGMLRADAELRQAEQCVPSYTGQWSPEDYYAAETEAWNRAADKLLAALEGE